MQFEHEDVVALAIDAGKAIMGVYESPEPVNIQVKTDDSPLTKADLAAHDVIVQGLVAISPNVPIVSEEGKVGDPLDSEFTWLVDPLDGTKEFIKRNGMFTVNIALMRRERERWAPVFGVVHAPVTETSWFGGNGVTATKIHQQSRETMAVRHHHPGPIRLVTSGSHRSERDELFSSQLGEHDLIRMGSSLKACAVADGSADLYPRFGLTSCWDIAAAHAVVDSAGGSVIGPDCQTLDYDVVDKVLNPFFLVASRDDWNELWSRNQD